MLEIIKKRLLKRLLFLFIFSCSSFSFKCSALNYYWVGGTGNWSDLSHWATTSGGVLFHTQIPTANDNVYFDGASFNAAGQVVTFNSATVLCRDMNWTGVTNNPALNGSTLNLIKIYGSLTFVPGMNLNFLGKFSFESTSTGKTITMASKFFLNEVFFNGINGEWALQDEFRVASKVTLNRGTLNTNNQIVSIVAFEAGAATLNMGSSIFNVSGGYLNPLNQVLSWLCSSTILNCGTSTINCTAINPLFYGGNQNYYELNFTSTNSTNSVIFGNNTFHTVVISSKTTLSQSNIIQNATFLKDAVLETNNIFTNLNLSAGRTYKLKSGSTQTINGYFNATGNCGALVDISSTTSGSQANISKLSGIVNTSFCILKDIKATGGASFAANNSINLGNNQGWMFTSPTSQNLYWIGNAGNWDDGNHWSFISGGAPSGCSPSPNDNVFFDINSFTIVGQSITLNQPSAYCKDMDWLGVTNNPTIIGSALNVLKIYGSLNFVSGININLFAKVNFEATSTGKTIAMGGNSFLSEVFFNGIGGEWTLQDEFRSTKKLFLNTGVLHTNNQTVNIFAFESGVATLNMGFSIFNIANNGGTYLEAWIANASTILNCGTSTINCTGNRPQFRGGGLTYYNLNFTNTSPQVYYLYGNNIFHDVVFSSTVNFIDSNTINNATFLGPAILYKNNSFTNLNFNAGKTYSLGNGTTQTINGIFNAVGNCNAFVDISTINPGSQAFISKPTGSVNTAFVILKDIIATGGASFTANNSIDLGNNQNWTFTTPTPKNLYWVENGGNWDDGNHWSLVSGGAPSGCSPTPNDNVFFDVNSFNIFGQSVVLNPSTAYCKDMSWQNVSYSPILNGSFTCTLKIFGSLKFVPGMLTFFQSNLNFEATSIGKTISLGGNTIRSSTSFNGVGGEWTLLDEFRSFYNIRLNSGFLNTNNQTVNVSAFSTGLATLNMGASIFNLSNNNGGTGSWSTYSTYSVLNCGTSTINCLGSNIQFIGGNYNYYNLNFTSTSSTNLQLFGNNTFQNVVCSSKVIVYNSNIIQNATFLGDALLNANNTFTNLTFSAGHSYKLKSGSTQKINNHFQIQGSCSNYIFLETTTQGSFATITKPSGSVLGFNIHIKDIHCVGGSIFNAYNSINLGGNTGWVFPALGPLMPPSLIIGPTTLCTGTNSVVYHTSPVVGALSYLWTVPAGATIVSGQGDTTITVNFGTASSSNISVNSFNGCNYSPTASILFITLANQLTPSVSLTSNHTGTICIGASVVFTAIALNTGNDIVNYNFKVNGISVQNSVTNAFTTTTLTNADIITCTITITGGACFTNTTATSNSITVLFNTNLALTPTVNIAASSTSAVCIGTSIVFTASVTNTGTALVTYNYKVNGISIQNNTSNIFSSTTLTNNNIVTCEINIINGTCLTTYTALSNAMIVSILPSLTTSIFIAASSTNICSGTSVLFTSNSINQGSTPIYQWKINGINVGSNASTFTTNSLNNNDIVSCVLTSDALCVTNSNTISNNISIQVNITPTPTLTLLASANNICQFTPVSFTALASNLGNSTVYQWLLNGNIVGANSATYTNSNLANNDIIKCNLSTNNTCSGTPILLNSNVTMVVKPKPIISFNPLAPSIFIGNSITLNANVTGNISTYLWTPAYGLNNSILSNPIANPSQTTTYNLKVTSNDNCVAVSNLTLKVFSKIFIPNSFTPNGDQINDIFRIPPSTYLKSLQYFIVYNRFGNKIFETNDITKGWDGTYKGIKSVTGNYTYLIKAFDNSGVVELKGNVLLIR